MSILPQSTLTTPKNLVIFGVLAFVAFAGFMYAYNKNVGGIRTRLS